MPEPLLALIFWDSSAFTPNALLQKQRQRQVREVNKNSLPIIPSQAMDTDNKMPQSLLRKPLNGDFQVGETGKLFV